MAEPTAPTVQDPNRRRRVARGLFVLAVILLMVYSVLDAIGFPLAPLVLSSALVALWHAGQRHGWADGYRAALKDRAERERTDA